MLQIILTFAFLIKYVLCFDINSKTNVALYWGQNSAGSQQSLASYCQSTDAEIYLLSFLSSFPKIGLNFANACTDTYADGTLHCSQIAQDIKTCQSLGKKILLSMGGASGNYGLANDAEASKFAVTLWNTFGEGSDPSIERPFDDAVIDGFDFDIENNMATGYVTLTNELRALFQQGSKQYYISAAPQCPYPDASVGELLANADVDFAFIQFYNNYCNVERQFNWETWKNFAETVSPNKNIKLYLGLPGAPSAAGSGYISDLNKLQSVVQSISEFSNFGGISLWDASQAVSNIVNGKDYVSNVKAILNDVTSSDHTITSSTLDLTSNLITNTEISPNPIKATTTLAPVTTTRVSSVSSTIQTPMLDVTPTNSGTTSVQAKVPTESEPTNVRSTTTLAPLPVPAQQSSNTNDITATTNSENPTVASLSATTRTTISPAEQTQQEQPTPTLSNPVNSNDSPAHVIAKEMNAKYMAGQFNGKPTCTDGELACSADGEFAICNFGKWVTMQCAAGTTCFAYDSGNTVLTQCGFTSEKNNYF